MNNMSCEELTTLVAECRNVIEIIDILMRSKLPLEEKIYCVMAASCYNGEMLDTANRKLKDIEKHLLKLQKNFSLKN